jgi:hypothetical protein
MTQAGLGELKLLQADSRNCAIVVCVKDGDAALNQAVSLRRRAAAGENRPSC